MERIFLLELEICIYNLPSLHQMYLLPISNKRERVIRAVPDTDFSERSATPEDNRPEHGIDCALELRGPVSGQVRDRVKVSFKIKNRMETRVLAGIEPRLADEHRSPPSVFG